MLTIFFPFLNDECIIYANISFQIKKEDNLMKKKFLLIALAALALASCDDNNSSNSTQTETKNIPLNVLKSIFGTFTAEGSDKIIYSAFDADIDNNVYVALGENEVEIGFNKKTEELEKTKYYNNNGNIAIEYRNAENESALVDLVNSNDEKIAWVFNNDISTSVKLADFVSTSEENVFTVNNAETRMIIARTLLTDVFYPIDQKTGEDPAVNSMTVKVTGEVISNITFTTANYYMYDKRYDDGKMDPFFEVYEEVNLNLSNHKSTNVAKDVVPYETYLEAADLKAAFQKFSNAEVTASIKYYKDEQLFLTSDSYFLSDLYYSVANNEGMGYVNMEDMNSLVKFNVVGDNITAEKVYEETSIASAGLTYVPSVVAAEMFKFENGKYVTRTIEDAQIIASYVLIDDMTEYLSDNISVTVNANSLLFEYELQITNTSGVKTTYACTMEVKEYVEGTLTFDLEPVKTNVRVMSNIPSELLGTFSSENDVLDIDTYSITLNDKQVLVSSFENNVFTGTYEGQEITLTYTSNLVTGDNGTQNLSTFDISIAGAEAVQVTFDSYLSNLVYVFNAIGVESLPAFDGAKYYYVDLSLIQTTGQIIFAIEADETKGGFTAEDLSAYVAALNANFFFDVSNQPTSKIFNVDSIEPVKSYLGVTYAYLVFNAAQTNLALAGFIVSDGLILIVVMM